MDRVSIAVLDKIFALSPAGRYVIIAEDEFYEDFPLDSDKTSEELKRALISLKRGGYIDVKYSRGDMYCVAPLKEYSEEVSPAPAAVSEEPKARKVDYAFLSAFAGGALGSLIISLIFAII